MSTPLESAVSNVYARIAAVSAELAKEGISKSRSNAQQGYKFRGIDEVLNALAPLLSKHQLVIIPRILSRECTERQTQKGGVLFSVVVAAEFDFISAVDGSKHTARTYGEAMDSGDKATNKAMSAAYKYAAFQAFCIPTEGDNDADAKTHEDIKPSANVAQTKKPAPPQKSPVISEDQRTVLNDIVADKGWKIPDVTELLKAHGFAKSTEITRGKYDEIKAALEAGPKATAA
jgi:hypothetical protein